MLNKIIIVLFTVFLYVNNAFVNGITVNTTSGVVNGLSIHMLNASIDQYLGIPFAKPPTGELRFAKPVPIDRPLDGVIDATKPKHSCIQELSSIMVSKDTSEDCLFLNIWSKSNHSSTLMPVMFWIYGGAFKQGSIFQVPPYNASTLAAQDVVVVSANYRLDVFGFLYGDDKTAPGNVGLYDQLLALKWVRENIHLFGGDKDQITIFGESAGSMSVSSHIMSPLSRGLFKRAIMESGAQMYNRDNPILSTTEALKQAKEMAKHFNCSEKHENWLKCLRDINANDLLEYSISKQRYIFPTEGTEFLPMSAQQSFKEGNYSKDIDLIAGVTRNEGSLIATLYVPQIHSLNNEKDFHSLLVFANQTYHGIDIEKVSKYYLKGVNTDSSDELKTAFYNFFGDVVIKCPTHLFAKQMANLNTKNNVYFYELTYQSSFMALIGCNETTMGICHGADLIFVFGVPFTLPVFTQIDSDFSSSMMKMWTNFAKNGKPDNEWPVFNARDSSGVKVKELNPHHMNNVLKEPFINECEHFWGKYFE